VGYSCAYSSTLSWLTPTLPLMAENNPRVVFERLFGSSDSTDPRVRASRLRQDRSILDSVTDRVKQLQQSLGSTDKTKVDDYLESLRDVERRIQKAEEQSARSGPEVDQPAGVPDGFEPHVQLLYELQLLAYQSDLTRVITFMYGREQTGRPYPQIGVPEPHHSLTHHQNDSVKMQKCTVIQTYHVSLFAKIPGSCVPRPMATARCSITRCFAGAASAAATATRTGRCRRCSGGGGGGSRRPSPSPRRHAVDRPQLTLLNRMGVPAEKLGAARAVHRALR
jgi:hypothetical protein